ncbi:hypothetical protein [Chitinophaga pinensis]|uniref:Uncharacterized protein n=1 Tax=Chitinophaga pinensis (strain ATCC 43595 / DSM 2588 / LMG 13176 / NBRC 15968 / NCIMB 11800 / UQM 2034) TaxID=485918 RepID=A0A979G3V4_CHIPD|nr:hypothetical protein [Chitinophaga pinensis]ACU60211.1 hypothetical protein Cpin_2732 [Chitinophaga pinensis DSM 2588]
MPQSSTYQRTEAPSLLRIAIGASVSILSAFVLGNCYAMSSSHSGTYRPQIVFIIIILAFMFLFKWLRGFTKSNNRTLHLVIAGLSCYICWAVSWDIQSYGGLKESVALQLPFNPRVLFQNIHERFEYLSSNTRIFICRPVILWIGYLGEFAAFVLLAKRISSSKV